MKKLVIGLLLLIVCTTMQATTVTGTITDPDGIAWANASFEFDFVPENGIPGPYLSGGSTFAQVVKGSLNGSGAISTTVTGLNTITPFGGSWSLTLCPTASVGCQVVQNVPITGSSVNIATYVATNITGLRFPAGPGANGYSDAEIQTPTAGITYFNTTLGSCRMYTGFSWVPCAGSPTLNPLSFTGGLDAAITSAKTAACANNSPQTIAVPVGSTSSSTLLQTAGINLTTTCGAPVSIECGTNATTPGHSATILYTGTAGGTVITKDTSRFNAGGHITNCVIDGNNVAGKILAIDTLSNWYFANNTFQGCTDSDSCVTVGANGATYELKWDHNKVYTNTGVGTTWANITANVVSNAITSYTINSGGNYLCNGIVGPVAVINGCTTNPSPMPTFTCSGNTITAVNGGTTGSAGCGTNTQLLVPELQLTTNYGVHTVNMTDSTSDDWIVANVGLVAGLRMDFGSNVWRHEHPYVGQPIGIWDTSTTSFHRDVECDSMATNCIKTTGQNIFIDGVMLIANNGQNPAGYKSYFAVDLPSGHRNVHVTNMHCGSANFAAGWAPYRWFGSYYNAANPGLTDPTSLGDNIQWAEDCTAATTTYTQTTAGPQRFQGPFVTGLPIVLTSQTAAISTTTLQFANEAQQVEVKVSVNCTTASAATVTPQVIYTDSLTSTTTTVAGTAATCTTSGAAGTTSMDLILNVKTATNIQVNTAITGSPTYDFRAVLQQDTVN